MFSAASFSSIPRVSRVNWAVSHFAQGCLLLFLLSGTAQAQGGGTAPDQSQAQPPEGMEEGGYMIHFSLEAGYRASDVTGSQPMYNTLVDLPAGARVFGESLSMQSKTHDGLLFDNLFISSYGWGGDPNQGWNIRADKGKWYDLRASYRRDQNSFEYDLLANPLNPPTSSPNIPVTFSPHTFLNHRRMSDFDLSVLPQSAITFRFGYSNDNMKGPSFSSVHEGTDALLSQDWDSQQNSYRFGVDYKPAARTVISYDQVFDIYDGTTTAQLAPFAPALVPPTTGIPSSIELGLPIDTVNKNPCGITAPATSLIDPSGMLTNLLCNGYYDYNRPDHIHTFTPTERVSMRSNYFERVELTASYAYSSSDMTAPQDEFFNGFSARSGLRQSTVTGPAHANEVTNVADFTATVHLTEHLRLVDTFRFWAFRINQNSDFTETDWIAPLTGGSCALPTCSVLTPISDTTQSATTTAEQLFFNQNWNRNETDLVWDISSRLGVHGGFRYGARDFNNFDSATATTNNITIHEYTPLVGLWVKPITGMRLNFDWEHSSYDNVLVRIGPRDESRYRINTRYTPKPWVVIGSSINLWKSSNGDVLTQYHGHNYNYGVSASLTPIERFGFDFSYNYNDYQQSALVCFNDADLTLPVVINAGSCTTNGFNDTKNNLLTNGYYTNSTHYGMALVMFKPIRRVTAHVGYSITSTNGQTPQFNSLQPAGTLQYNYQQPLADVAYYIGHNVTAKAGWNYYQYGEGSFVGPTDPRNFHANNVAMSLLWAF
jgi:hypothetical protein